MTTSEYGFMMENNFPHRLLQWIRENKKGLLEYYVPDTCDTSKGQPKFGELRNTLFGFDRRYRGEQQILSGAKPLPSMIYAGSARRAAESCLMRILDLQAMLTGPLWESFYSMPGLLQVEFTPLAWKYLDHNRLPIWTKAFPHAVVSMKEVNQVEFILNNGTLSKTHVKTLDYPDTGGLPLGEQVQFLNNYGAKIRELIRSTLKDPANWPTDAEALVAAKQAAQAAAAAELIRAKTLARTAFRHLSAADKEILLSHPQVITEVLNGF